MVRDPDALQMVERIQVRLDTLTVETAGQAQSQAGEVGEGWEWKEEEERAQVEDKMVMQDSLARKGPGRAFEQEKVRLRWIALEPWMDEEYELRVAAAAAERQGSCGVGQAQEDERKEGVDNNFEYTAAESCGHKELYIERGQKEEWDSKDPGGEQRDTRSHSGKQDNTCKE